MLEKAEIATPILGDLGVDLLLSGHMHTSSQDDFKAPLTKLMRNIVIVGAGTAISDRTRSEANSYNIIELTKDELKVKVRIWKENSFVEMGSHVFRKSSEGWKRNEKQV
jgi:predicted phosphodiesterase